MSDTAQDFISEAREYLRGHYLAKIERCLERLTDEQVWWRANAESNSVGNLLLHLEGNARQWIVAGVGGGGEDVRERDGEFAAEGGRSRAELLEKLRRTLAEIDGVLARLDDEGLAERRRIQGRDVTVLAAVFHVVEHFSMHTGQIVLLTKMLTARDLAFYDFSGGAPREAWR